MVVNTQELPRPVRALLEVLRARKSDQTLEVDDWSQPPPHRYRSPSER